MAVTKNKYLRSSNFFHCLFLTLLCGVHSQTSNSSSSFSCSSQSGVLLACTTCLGGWSLNEDADACIECPSNCQLCEEDGGTVSCILCNDGFSLDSAGDCTDCQTTSCKKCTFDTNNIATCMTCVDGYYLDTATCKACDFNCELCTLDSVTGSGVCTNCTSGYILNTGDTGSQCLLCHSSCESCTGTPLSTSRATCTGCTQGYGLSGGQCLSCVDQCLSCDSDSSDVMTCISCDTGYGVISGGCQVCTDTFASTCTFLANGTDVWNTCIDGYGFNGYPYCGVCPSNCLSCSKDYDKCEGCEQGYVLDLDDYCTACPSNCDSCTYGWDGSAYSSHCTECSSAYTLIGSTGKCQACPALCTNCTHDTSYNNSIRCTSCDDGYFYQDHTGRCQSCITNCIECSDWQNCTTCVEGYASATNRCIECSSQCADCFINGSRYDAASDRVIYSTICYDCMDQYGLEEQDICVECPAGCVDCYNENTMLCSGYCLAGYGYNSATELCEVCLSNCDTCEYQASSGTVVCLTCDYGYVVNDTSGNCQKCSLGCSTCSYDSTTKTAKCTLCEDTYLLNTGGTCENCPDNCQWCFTDETTATVICETCITGYGFDSSTACVACSDECLSCETNIAGDMVCTECNSYYGLLTGCGECPTSRCASCKAQSGSMVCTQCEDGYTRKRLSTDTYTCIACSQMITNCVSCTDISTGSVQCTECRSGYALSPNGTLCSACSQFSPCEDCAYVDESCSGCDAGYVMDEQRQTCIPACYSCLDQESGEEDASWQSMAQCGLNVASVDYQLHACEVGSCWVHLKIEDNITVYKRGCYDTECTDNYKYRVCTEYEEEDRMECSRCCSTGGCNGFSLTALSSAVRYQQYIPNIFCIVTVLFFILKF